MRKAWTASLVAVAIAAGAGGYAAGRAGRPDPAAGPTPAELAFARLLAQGDTAADPPPAPAAIAAPVRAVQVDAATKAYADRVLALADRDGADPRRLPLLRSAARGLALAELVDVDGDGLDDDGKVQVGPACVLLPVSASYDVDFADGPCAAAGVHSSVGGDAAYGPKPFPESYLRTL